MKKFFTFIICLALTAAATSCDDKEDTKKEGGSDDIGTCYITVEGQRTDFDYAYLVSDEGETITVFSTIDILYYYKNPDKIKRGMMLSALSVYSNNELSGGEIPFGEYDLEFIPTIDYYELFSDADESDYQEYTTDTDPGYESGPLKVTVLSDHSYKLEIASLKLTYGYGDNDDEPKSTGTFYFEGKLTDASSMVQMSSSDRSAMREVRDPGFGKWVKSLNRTAVSER